MKRTITINGLKLRELINSNDTSEENCKNILKQLIKCYQEIQHKIKLDEYWFDEETDMLQEDIDCAAFDEEAVNYHLNNFYDICDILKIWVSK